MNFLSDIPAAMAAIDNFLIQHARDLPAAAVAALVSASSQPSPVDKIVLFGETVYAMGATASAEAKTAAAQVVEFASRYSWHGLGDNGRGHGIVSALCRDLGETAPAAGWPDPKADPAPRDDLVASLGLAPVSQAVGQPASAAPAAEASDKSA